MDTDITSIILNQIVISDPIINKIKLHPENYNQDDLEKFRKLPNGFGGYINNEIIVKDCYNSGGVLQRSGGKLSRHIPENYDTNISHIKVAKCYKINGKHSTPDTPKTPNNELKKSGKQLYYIIDGRHRMVSAILNSQTRVNVRVVE
jgi:hypothetical protein